jgi:hypothetical protein
MSTQSKTAANDELVNVRRRLAEEYFIPLMSGTFFDESNPEKVTESYRELAKFVNAITKIRQAYDKEYEEVDHDKFVGLDYFRKPRVNQPKARKSVSASIFD